MPVAVLKEIMVVRSASCRGRDGEDEEKERRFTKWQKNGRGFELSKHLVHIAEHEDWKSLLIIRFTVTSASYT